MGYRLAMLSAVLVAAAGATLPTSPVSAAGDAATAAAGRAGQVRVSSEVFLPRAPGSTLDCPEPGPAENPRAAVGGYDTFRLESDDADTKAFRYGFDGGPDPDRTVPVVGGVALIRSWQAQRSGWHALSVLAVDGAGQATGSATCTFPVSSRRSVAEWAMNEGAGAAQIADARARLPLRVAAGAIPGAPGPKCAVSGCPTSRAVGLTGVRDSYLAGPPADSINGAESFSVSAWAWRDDVPGARSLLSVDGARGSQFWLGASAGKWVFAVRDSDASDAAATTVASAADAAARRWVHLAAVFDRYRGTVQLFVDGRAEPAVSRAAPGWGAAGAVQVGRRKLDDGYGETWTGLVSEAALYDRVLVAPEVEALSVRPATRQGYWQLNHTHGGDGEQVSPEQRGGVPMALGGAARVVDAASAGVTPLVGTGFLGSLDGRDGYAFVEKSPIDTSDSFTVAARVRLSAEGCGKGEPMAVLSQAGVRRAAFEVRCRWEADDDAGRWEVVLTGGDAVAARELTVLSAVLLSTDRDGEHLAAVVDTASRTVRLYADGRAIGAATMPADFAPWNAVAGLQVGRSRVVGGRFGHYLRGEVDDIRVYRGAADPATVARMADSYEQPDL
ncbi:hypothetical protein GCM10010124_08630 [Pilimelia terevasa]|uniref:LamG-like jellyroll fold domain-containing protein n=1 Tax=Pilimelia terevasa TaxID=53372 RepID=A0A8J3FF13_9ACTN|nr:LamG domain-containing protein [Pilimelia terevasa]GGK18319.1 hypothetical protein GCM10010124_08630 [Pilimelia terevasa]